MATNKKKTKKTTKRNAWFKAIRGSYLPASSAGWLTYIPFVGYLLLSLGVVIKEEHSLLSGVVLVAVNWIAAAAIMTYIAAHKS